MKTKKITLLLLVVASTFLFFSIASFAEARTRSGYAGKPGASPSGFLNQEHFASGKCFGFSERGAKPWGIMNLDLSQEQVAEINQIGLDFQKASLEIKKEMETKKIEIREMMMEDPIDMEKIRAKWEEIAQIQVELRIKALENQIKIKEVLTQEQLAECPISFSGTRFHNEMRTPNYYRCKESWR
jgi:Spy/CpxP family protein refolding chaperone